MVELWRLRALGGLAVLVAVVAGFAAGALACDSDDDEAATPTQSAGEPTVAAAQTSTVVAGASAVASPTETLDDFEKVARALRSDAVSSRILAGVDFTVLRVFPLTRDGQRIGTAAHVELSGVVEGHGPWLSVRCQGTRQYAQRRLKTNVTLLTVRISNSGELVGFTPAAFNVDAEGRILNPLVDHPETATEATVTDLRDGTIIFHTDDIWAEDPDVLSETWACPPGFEDND